MNNKGFAITGVLYTIMILFLLILISILAALSSRNNLLKKSVEKLENRFEGKTVETEILTSAQTAFNTEESIAPVTGKYKFTTSDTSVPECYSFIKKDSSFKTENIIFTTKTCNDLITSGTFSLVSIYMFES